MPNSLITLENMFQRIDECELILREKKIKVNIQCLAIHHSKNLDRSIVDARSVFVTFGVEAPTMPEIIRRRVSPIREQAYPHVKIDAEIRDKHFPSWMTRTMVADNKRYQKRHRELTTRLEVCRKAITNLDVLPSHQFDPILDKNLVKTEYLTVLHRELRTLARKALNDLHNR